MNEEELLTITPTPTAEPTATPTPLPTPTPIDYTELLTEIKQEVAEMNEEVYLMGQDVRIIVVLVLLTFCWSCMRQWRKNVLKGAK